MANWSWLDAIKLGCITVGVAALQLLKIALLSADDQERQRRRLRDRRPGEPDSEERGFLEGLSPEFRRALVDMIDYQVTPVLVDQWRLGLVKVLLDPQEGPVLEETDPQLRKALLDSIQSHQEEQHQRPAFRRGQTPSRYRFEDITESEDEPGPSHPRNPVMVTPAPAMQVQQESSSRQEYHAMPSLDRERRGDSAASSSRPSGGPSNPRRLEQPLQSETGSAGSSRGGTSEEAAAQKLAALSSEEAQPSAPRLYPDIDAPSAPPLTAEVSLSQTAQNTDPEREECGICMDAMVEVQIDQCQHQMCCECAKAICCLEGRAPQCPFCRGPMLGVSAIKPLT